MAISDLMKRGYLSSATAIHATVATNSNRHCSTVATVAPVAVATARKSNLRFMQHKKMPHVGMPMHLDEGSVEHRKLQALMPFNLDVVLKEIDAGYPASDLQRVTNMACEFMQVDGMRFKEAIQLAADVVVRGHFAQCEKNYVDVFEMFRKCANE